MSCVLAPPGRADISLSDPSRLDRLHDVLEAHCGAAELSLDYSLAPRSTAFERLAISNEALPPDQIAKLNTAFAAVRIERVEVLFCHKGANPRFTIAIFLSRHTASRLGRPQINGFRISRGMVEALGSVSS